MQLSREEARQVWEGDRRKEKRRLLLWLGVVLICFLFVLCFRKDVAYYSVKFTPLQNIKSYWLGIKLFFSELFRSPYAEKKDALIDVTDDSDNTEIMLEHSFPGIELSGTFPVTKGRKYRFAIYTLLPETGTEISININGYNKIRSYFANRKS